MNRNAFECVQVLMAMLKHLAFPVPLDCVAFNAIISLLTCINHSAFFPCFFRFLLAPILFAQVLVFIWPSNVIFCLRSTLYATVFIHFFLSACVKGSSPLDDNLLSALRLLLYCPI